VRERSKGVLLHLLSFFDGEGRERTEGGCVCHLKLFVQLLEFTDVRWEVIEAEVFLGFQEKW
jgi:hypothetical protein